MKQLILVTSLLALSACATGPTTNLREELVQNCVDKYLLKDVKAETAFEMCRQIYHLRTIAEVQEATQAQSVKK